MVLRRITCDPMCSESHPIWRAANTDSSWYWYPGLSPRVVALLFPVDASFPIEIAEHFASWMTLSSMTQPFAQFGPIRPGWSAVGGVHGQAAWQSSNPRTVM